MITGLSLQGHLLFIMEDNRDRGIKIDLTETGPAITAPHHKEIFKTVLPRALCKGMREITLRSRATLSQDKMEGVMIHLGVETSLLLAGGQILGKDSVETMHHPVEGMVTMMTGEAQRLHIKEILTKEIEETLLHKNKGISHKDQ